MANARRQTDPMTADEWDEHVRACNPKPLAEFAWPTASLRRRRLFLLAVHLRGGYDPADGWERHLLRVAEKAAGGYIGANHLQREAGEAYRRVRAAAGRLAVTESAAQWEARRLAAAAVLIDPDLRPWVLNWQPLHAAPVRDHRPGEGRTVGEWTAMALGLVRCVLGDPTRPVKFRPDWRTEAVVELARVIDADRAFDLLPVLADALDDAGCREPAVIGHCRDDVTHARGCWVVDGVLGKS